MGTTHTAALSRSRKGLIPLLLFSGGLTTAGVGSALLNARGGWGGVLTNAALTDSLVFSLWIAVVSTAISLVGGVVLALAVHAMRRRRRHLAQVYRIPLILPHITVAFIVLLLWTPSGIVPALLYQLGLVATPQDLGPVLYSGNGWGIIIAYVLKEIPFVMVLALGALGQLDPRLELAARNLGAGNRLITRDLYLPHIRGSVHTAGVIIFLYSFGAYEIPFLVGESYPAAISVHIMRDLFRQNPSERAQANAFMVMVFVFSMALLASRLRHTAGDSRSGIGW